MKLNKNIVFYETLPICRLSDLIWERVRELIQIIFTVQKFCKIVWKPNQANRLSDWVYFSSSDSILLIIIRSFRSAQTPALDNGPIDTMFKHCARNFPFWRVYRWQSKSSTSYFVKIDLTKSGDFTITICFVPVIFIFCQLRAWVLNRLV